jgi:recombinational DNA repair ATPase RecF
MFISRLSLKNFGPFESADFSFAPTGISVLYGPNGSGKTQITGAMLATAVGRRAIKFDKKGIGPTKVQVSATYDFWAFRPSAAAPCCRSAH